MLDDLHALVEFAQAGSIAGAADRLFRTPSAAKGSHTVDQNRSDGPAYGNSALRLSRCLSKYTSAALNNIIHDE